MAQESIFISVVANDEGYNHSKRQFLSVPAGNFPVRLSLFNLEMTGLADL